MLTITIPPSPDKWDPIKEEFVPGTEEWTITLEHSLITISKWEEKHLKPFIGDGTDKYKKTPEEMMDYFKCMTRTKNVPEEVYDALTTENIKEINEYINAPMTATVINYNKKRPPKKRVQTAETIYASMIALGIPSRFEKWHINKLLTLIEVVNIENDPNPKKMSRMEILAQNKSLNEMRRAKAKAKSGS